MLASRLHRSGLGNLFLSISSLLHGTLLHNQGYNTGKLSFKLEKKQGGHQGTIGSEIKGRIISVNCLYAIKFHLRNR